MRNCAHTSESSDVIDGAMEAADGGAAEALGLSGESAQATVNVRIRKRRHGVVDGRMRNGAERGRRYNREGIWRVRRVGGRR